MPIDWNLSRRVVIRNLGETPTKNEIKVLFGRYGKINKLWVARNPPGIAFLEYENRRSAETAACKLDGKSCCGSYIKVDLSIDHLEKRVSNRRYQGRKSSRPKELESSKEHNRIRSRSGERTSPGCSACSHNVQSNKPTSSKSETHRSHRQKHLEDVDDCRSRSRTRGRQRLDCSICFGNIIKRKPTITPCRHVFCESCIRKAIQKQEKCPICQTTTQEKQLQPIYLNP